MDTTAGLWARFNHSSHWFLPFCLRSATLKTRILQLRHTSGWITVDLESGRASPLLASTLKPGSGRAFLIVAFILISSHPVAEHLFHVGNVKVARASSARCVFVRLPRTHPPLV